MGINTQESPGAGEPRRRKGGLLAEGFLGWVGAGQQGGGLGKEGGAQRRSRRGDLLPKLQRQRADP